MPWIEKNGQSWRVRWFEGGQKRGYTVSSKPLAREVLVELERALALGTGWRPGSLQAGVDASLWDLGKRYLADARRRLAPRTVVRKEQMVGPWLRWWHKQLRREPRCSDLSRAMLERFYDALTVDGIGDKNPIQASSAARILQEVELCWKWWHTNARDLGADVPTPVSLQLKVRRPPVPPAPTWAEMDAMVSASRGWHRHLAMVARCTGLRVAQCMALTWDDVTGLGDTAPPGGGVPSEGHAAPASGVPVMLWVRTGKGDLERQGRHIPMAPVLVAYLLELRAAGEADPFYVVPSGRHQGPRHREARARDARRAWERSGVREVVWGRRPWHALRAGFCASLTRAGADREAVEYLVGHSRGVRARYVDGTALPLVEAVGLVPPVHL